MSTTTAMEKWLATRPECVQKLAKEFPAGSSFSHNGETLYVIGWTENDALIVSPVWCDDDYDLSLKLKKYVCASHFRGTCSCGGTKPS